MTPEQNHPEKIKKSLPDNPEAIMLKFILLMLIFSLSTITKAQGYSQMVSLKVTASVVRTGPVSLQVIKNQNMVIRDNTQESTTRFSSVSENNLFILMSVCPNGTSVYMRYFFSRYPAGVTEGKILFYITGFPLYDEVSAALINPGDFFSLQDNEKYYFWVSAEVPEKLLRVNKNFGDLTIEIAYL